MSEPTRLQAPTATPHPRPSACGGALLQVTREQLGALKRDGVEFSRVEQTGGQYLDARVRCHGEIQVQRFEDALEPDNPRSKVIVRIVRAGICQSCASLEAYVCRMRRPG